MISFKIYKLMYMKRWLKLFRSIELSVSWYPQIISHTHNANNII